MPIQFSFIIPVYNCVSYLEECVKSIVRQPLTDYEILLIDDGSTDGSSELCDLLQHLTCTIHVLHKENGGAASARNAGIELSQGAYLMFIDGDDTLSPNCMEELLPVLQSGPCMPVFGMAFDYWDNGTLLHTDIRSIHFDGEYSTKQVAQNLPAFFEDNVLSSACNKVFSAAVIRAQHLRFPAGATLYEDFSFVLSYMMNINSILCLPKPLYHYRNNLADGHFMQRISDLGKLEQNLSCLNQILLGFGHYYDASDMAATTAANLSMQLLSQHILNAKYHERHLKKLLPKFLSNSSLQKVLAEKPVLTSESVTLYSEIEHGQFGRIYNRYRIKKIKRSIRRTAKRVLIR